MRFRLRPDEERRMLERWGLTIQPLTPLLKESGSEFEKDVVEQIQRGGERVIDLGDNDMTETSAWLTRASEPVILYQPSLAAPLGEYDCHGRADVIRLSRNRQGTLDVLVADIKASRHERMEHRLQVATYAFMLRNMAQESGVKIGLLRGSVLSLDEGQVPVLDADTPSFDLDIYLSILDHLAVGPDSVVDRVASLRFDQISYHLGYKCDGCFYNAICMYDSAERLDLSLVPYISAVEKRVLQAAGISTLPELAGLMTLPASGSGERELLVASGKENTVTALSGQWPVGPNLPLLVQRARRALKRFDPSIDSRSYLYGAGFGTLPSEEDHPELVKVFLDAQDDYLLDRVYMISALVTGPHGSRSIVHCVDSPPSEKSERELLMSWVLEVVGALSAVAASSSAPVHLYCYNRYDQQVLLEALKRHLEQIAGLPAFFDLMTQTPALTQPIISFLSDEIKERFNLGAICVPLHDAARILGFNWDDGSHPFYSLFRARLFDNRRDMMRKPDGRLVRADRTTSKEDPSRITIEAASRFNSQIPLEYAYAAWGALPTVLEDDRTLEPFRTVSLDDLKAFAAHRTRALAHIESRFQRKARWVPKPPLDLPALASSPASTASLEQSLEEFLYMEHHASLQGKILNYSLPIERRAQTGLALLIRFQQSTSKGFRFGIDFAMMGLDPVVTMNAFRMKEGDWVVINAVEPSVSAGKIKNGRLATIETLGPNWIELKLLGVTYFGSRFRYPHDNKLEPEHGALYTLDQMADELNSDKALEALHHADTNILYKWLLKAPSTRAVAPATKKYFEQFAGLVDTLEGKHRPTGRQREVITERLANPLFIVQGPPGTGKSQTLSWAVLARVAGALHDKGSCRVAVCCKTHNAVNIVLEAIAIKLQKLKGFPTPLTRGLETLQVYKLVNDDEEYLAVGVRPMNAYGLRGKPLEDLLQRPVVVIGGTPGGLYNLGKYRSAGGRQVDWTEKPFDLLVIDEASQMSLPEGILASSFLKPTGTEIVVGDHRQMPPIIAHTWEDEQKRTATSNRPYLSLFESLVERGIPRVGLDESFRLHETIADFLRDNIYNLDGIRFFSKRKELLTQPPRVDPFVQLALDPAYPIVVIEHGEVGSQQYNETEVCLIEPIIEVCANNLRLDGKDGIGVVVPHRAQKAMLRARFPDLAVLDSIDTVERFQGGERDVIIVSATASDPDYVLAEADFLLNLNRLNVALSRPRKKLIVVASRSVVQLLTSDLDIFGNAVIWKRLYYYWASDRLWEGIRCGVPVQLKGKPAARAK